MRIWRYDEALAVVKNEFDLNNESFILPDEYVGYFNKGIQLAASDIYKLGVEDEYFQSEQPMSIVDGQNNYPLPTKIYAHKMRTMIYQSGTEIYEIKRMRRKQKFLKEVKIDQYMKDGRYQYRIRNSGTAAGAEIILIPTPRGSLSNVITMYFIREAEFIPLVTAGSQAATDATKIDLPECQNFIFAYVKWRVAQKIPHPNLVSYKDDFDEERAQMIATLTGETDDDNTELEPDLSHYQESS